MALRTLLLQQKIKEKRTALSELLKKGEQLKLRTSNAERALQELNENSTAEERTAVENEVNSIDEEQQDFNSSKETLENEISELETELETEEKKQRTAGSKITTRTGGSGKMIRAEFYGMDIQERDAFFADEGVKTFISQLRTCIKEKRSLQNAGILIPEVMMDVLRPKIIAASKLIGKVYLKKIKGKGRQVIMGEIPEAVWTEAVGVLNELSLGFNQIEVDGYKVAGYFAIANSNIEDSDIDLVKEVIDALSKSVGRAIDKSIVYGTGVKMPLGFVTRLAQTEKPSDYSKTARDWQDLHTSNVITGKGSTGLALFKEINNNSACIETDYADSEIFWVMNRKTHRKLISESIDKNANAAIVAGMNNEMPVIGGEIVEESFMPDNNIAFGYGGCYCMVEREGTVIDQSEHCKFLEDQTVVRGVARYDGMPSIAEAFGIITIDTSSPVTSVTFAEDTANAD